MCYNVNSMDSLGKKLKSKLPGLKVNESLAPFSSFKIGGPAKYFYNATDIQKVQKASKIAQDEGIPVFILGGGTNVLISDKGFDGLVIKMENNKIEINNTEIVAESGAMLQKVIRESIAKNLTGLEFLIGIPGTLGGAISGNVGTPTEWIGEKVKEVQIVNASKEIVTVPKSQCDFSYRFSRFKYDDKEIILSATLTLEKSSQKPIQEKVQSYLAKKSHQPTNALCAGSIFKNPENKKAWQIIDQVGLRGKQIGGAKVSTEHSNFIINTGQATAEDIIILISLIKQQVRDDLGIQLQEEIKYIGF